MNVRLPGGPADAKYTRGLDDNNEPVHVSCARLIIITASALLTLSGIAAFIGIVIDTNSKPSTLAVLQPASGIAARPLVIDIHGAGGTPIKMSSGSGIREQAAALNWHVSWPSGYRKVWNAGPDMYNPAASSNIDHVAELIDHVTNLRASLNITNVFVTGVSNGCAMAMRLGIQAPAGTIDAIACWGHAMSTSTVLSSTPVPRPMLLLTGSDDYVFAPQTRVVDTLTTWKTHNGCSGDLSTYTSDGPGASIASIDGCPAGSPIEHVVYAGYGHGTGPIENIAQRQVNFFSIHSR